MQHTVDVIVLTYKPPKGVLQLDRDDREAGLSHTEADSHEHRGEIFRRALLWHRLS